MAVVAMGPDAGNVAAVVYGAGEGDVAAVVTGAGEGGVAAVVAGDVLVGASVKGVDMGACVCFLLASSRDMNCCVCGFEATLIIAWAASLTSRQWDCIT
jgi:hypothetical protein